MTELESELRSADTTDQVQSQGQVLSEGGSITVPTLCGCKLRQSGMPEVPLLDSATSELTSNASYRPLQKREGEREPEKMEKGGGQGKDGGGELKEGREESASLWTGSP